MQIQKYSVNHYPIQTLLTWITSNEIAIPEIQRPIVWEPVKVRNLLDSLYQGYPIGYLIAWRNPNVKLKDGTTSTGKRVLIDGQQRVMALMAALLGHDVVTKEYATVRIRIAFNPSTEAFEVSNPAIQNDSEWISDILTIFSPEFHILPFVTSYTSKQAAANPDLVFDRVERLRGIVNNPVGLIELNSDLSIEEVTEIFIRVNSMGTELSQADFVMSKIASNEKYQGTTLRKAIDYFSHLSVAPEFFASIAKNDLEFAGTAFFRQMSWLKAENDDIYDPTYTDMLRVAFTSEFKRGRLQDLVALLSGRNFETKQYEEAIAEASFAQLGQGISSFINETHFKRFVMIIRSSGFVDSSLIGSQTALDMAYIAYLVMRAKQKEASAIERAVRRWFVLSTLTGRYSGQAESTMDSDIRRVSEFGVEEYVSTVLQAELSGAFWSNLLPQQMNTSSAASPYLHVFKAAQVRAKDKGFLSRDITVQDLILNRSDIHHIFPKNYLKKQGMTKGRYNQIGNYAVTQSEINISIGDRPPVDYFGHLRDQVSGGKRRYGGITDPDELRENYDAHCIPQGIEEMTSENFDEFLLMRRQLMASKLERYFHGL